MVPQPPPEQPDLRPVEISATPSGSGAWDVTWTLANAGASPLVIEEAWAPHGRFRSPAASLDPPAAISPQRTARLTLRVEAQEGPRTEVPNTFLILRVRWRDESWRVFIRMLAVFRTEWDLELRPQLVTTQRAGSTGAADR